MTAPRYVQVYNPLGWTATQWMARDLDGGYMPGYLPTGVTLGTVPAHPFAGALGEQVVQFAANSQMLVQVTPSGTEGVTPDASHRWAVVRSALVYLPSYPASEATLWSGYEDPCVLNVTPSGTLRLYTGTGLPLVGESTVSYPLGTWRQLEVFEVYRDSAGNLLSTKQWVVRVADLAPAWITYINVNANPSATGYAYGFNGTLGFSGTASAPYFPSPAMDLANVWGGWEDGDAPFGLRRQDGQRPNGIGHLNQWPGNAANVRDVLPDDVTTENSVTFFSGYAMQLYTLTPPAYITATDLLTGSIELGADLAFPLAGKGGTNTISPLISDGTTDVVLILLTTDTNYQWKLEAREGTIGGAVPWTLAALQGLQVGAEAYTNTNVSTTFNESAYLVIVPYARELGPALPAPVVPLAVPSLAYDQPSRQIWLPSRARGY